MEKQFVAFKVGSAFYCIDIMEVQEVIRENQITHMPSFPSFVEGVINLRGVITPLISIDKRLSFFSQKAISSEGDKFDNFMSKFDKPVQEVSVDVVSSKKPEMAQKLIIINVESITIGLLVDTLDKILTVDEQQVQNAEGLGKASKHKMIVGVLQVEEHIYTVLEPRYVLENDEAQQLAESLKK